MKRLIVGLGALLLATTALDAATIAPRDADAPAATSAGATFTVPKAWAQRGDGAFVAVSAPEGDTSIAIVDVPVAADAGAAAAAAWINYRPDARRKVRLTTPRAARNGWDERVVIDYETSPNEKAVVQAVVLRKAKAWTVLIVDGSEATFEKRGAAAGLVLQSLRPAGYSRETFAGRTARPLDAARIAAMKAFVADAMAQLDVPGAGIALIDQGKIVYEGGIGVRELGKPTPVDANTLFMIASNTKGMSTLLLAELVDEGKLRWDQKVTEVFPKFRLGSAATTAKVEIRHLVCACTGLPRKDLEWIFNTSATTPASTTFDQLAATEPTSGFGEVFQYNNLMATAAGYVGAHLVYPGRELGAAYDAAMEAKIFAPLGMTATTFDMKRALAGNHASPHGENLDGKPAIGTQELNYAIAPYRPAGGAWSSAHDMARYVANELSEGMLPNGKRLVSAKNLLMRRAPSVPSGEDQFYGMGLSGNSIWGVPVVNHGGSLAGYKSDIVFLPEAKVGAVLLTNSENGQALLRPFMRRLLEILYDGKPEAVGDVAAAVTRIAAQTAEAKARLTLPAAPAAVAALAAAYASPELGNLAVRRTPTGLVFAFQNYTLRMGSHVNDDGTTSFISDDPTLGGIELVVGTRGGKRILVTRDGQHEYAFVEVG